MRLALWGSMQRREHQDQESRASIIQSLTMQSTMEPRHQVTGSKHFNPTGSLHMTSTESGRPKLRRSRSERCVAQCILCKTKITQPLCLNEGISNFISASYWDFHDPAGTYWQCWSYLSGCNGTSWIWILPGSAATYLSRGISTWASKVALGLWSPLVGSKGIT